MTPIEAAGLTIFILVLFAGVFSNIYGIPGTLVILIDIIIYAWITGFEEITLNILVALFVISLFAESIDFLLGIVGSRKFGSSRKAFIISIAGGIAGAILLTPVLFGLGTLLGSFLGGFIGMFTVSYIEDKKKKTSVRIPGKYFFSKAAGVLLKGTLSIIMTVTTLSKIYS